MQVITDEKNPPFLQQNIYKTIYIYKLFLYILWIQLEMHVTYCFKYILIHYVAW